MKKLFLMMPLLLLLFGNSTIINTGENSHNDTKKILNHECTIEQRDTIPNVSYSSSGNFYVQFDVQSNAKTFSDVNDGLIGIIALKSNRNSFKLLKEEGDELGFTHYTYQQEFDEIPVHNCKVKVHTENGKLRIVNGSVEENVDINTDYDTSESQIQDFVLEYLEMTEADILHFEISKIINCNDGCELTWLVKMADKSLDKSFKFVISDSPIRVVSKISLNHTCNGGSCTTNWYGTKNIQTDFQSNRFILLDDCQTAQIRTRNANQNGTFTEYEDTDNIWSTNAQRSAATTHWGTKMSQNFFLQTFNRNGFDGNSRNVDVRHNDLINGSTYNASFNSIWGIMRIGIGNPNTNADDYNPIDIVGHEFAHGVTGTSANLNYENESGALNESFSDIFGSMIERFADPNSFDWTHGEDRGSISRSLQNPNLKGDPDTYQGQHWHTSTSDYGGVHTNSGVQNHWFYLLSEGGNGTNDNGDSYNVQGIGIEEAGRIAYRNLTVYLIATSNYQDTRAGAIMAAKDLYGADSNEVIQVTNAWYAVGVGAAYQSSTQANVYLSNVTVSDNTVNPGQTITVNARQYISPSNATSVNSKLEYAWDTNTTWSGATVFGSDYSSIGNGDSYDAESINFTVPTNASGTIYLHLRADATDVVTNEPNNSDNYKYIALTVNGGGNAANVYLSNVTVSDNTVNPGQTITVNARQYISPSNATSVNSKLEYAWDTNTTWSGATVFGSDYSSIGNGDSYDAESINFTVPTNASGTIYLHLRADATDVVTNEPNNSDNYKYIALTVNGGGGSSCSTPNNLRATNVTSTTCNLSWNAVGSASSYILYYWNGSSWQSFGSTNSNSTYIEGMSSGYQYCFSVQAICGNESSSLSDYVCISTSTNSTTTLTNGLDDEVIFEHYQNLGTDVYEELKVNEATEDKLNMLDFDIFPNPVKLNSKVTLKLSDDVDRNVKMFVFNQAGGLVDNQVILPTVDSEVSIQNLNAPDIYFITIDDGVEKVIKKLIIIN